MRTPCPTTPEVKIPVLPRSCARAERPMPPAKPAGQRKKEVLESSDPSRFFNFRHKTDKPWNVYQTVTHLPNGGICTEQRITYRKKEYVPNSELPTEWRNMYRTANYLPNDGISFKAPETTIGTVTSMCCMWPRQPFPPAPQLQPTNPFGTAYRTLPSIEAAGVATSNIPLAHPGNLRWPMIITPLRYRTPFPESGVPHILESFIFLNDEKTKRATSFHHL